MIIKEPTVNSINLREAPAPCKRVRFVGGGSEI